MDEEVDKEKVTKEAREIWDELSDNVDGKELTEEEMKVKLAKKAIGDEVDTNELYLVITLLEFVSDVYEERKKQKKKKQSGSNKDEDEAPGIRYR